MEVVELADAGDAREGHLGERSRGPAEVESGSRRPASSYIASRQVQKSPPPAWVRPRRARWKAWEWAFARPGQDEAEEAVALRGRRADARRDRGDPVALHLDQDARLRDLAAEPGELAPVGTRRHEPTRSTNSRDPRSNASRWKRSYCSQVVSVRGSAPVDEEHPVEVVHLVLEGAGGEPALDLDVLVAVAVEIADADVDVALRARPAGRGPRGSPR